MPAFNYENDFGGVIYLFVRGVRIWGDSGVFSYKPPLEMIEKVEQILNGQEIGRAVTGI
jgi:exodeoxyribonuclease V beta subunit